MTQIEIFEAEFDEDDWACCAYFPVEPYGRVQLAAQDTSHESRKLIQDLADNWSGLWSKMDSQPDEVAPPRSRSVASAALRPTGSLPLLLFWL